MNIDGTVMTVCIEYCCWQGEVLLNLLKLITEVLEENRYITNLKSKWWSHLHRLLPEAIYTICTIWAHPYMEKVLASEGRLPTHLL